MNKEGIITLKEACDLVNYALLEFYKHDHLLLDYKTEKDAIAERCMVFHIGCYMIEKIKSNSKFADYDVDCEYNRNFNAPKGMYKQVLEKIESRNTYPDMVVHKRRSNKNNLIVIEFKKGRATEDAKKRDIEKLCYFTDPNREYCYNFGLYVELFKKCAKIKIFQNGKEMGASNYTVEI